MKPTHPRIEPIKPLETVLPSLISVEGLAGHWKISPDTVRLWCRTNKIKSIRIGRKILIDVDSLPSAESA